ncbi:MAG: D-lyxose/D-mannose family sugar isomerase [Opitutaceae bacterium]
MKRSEINRIHREAAAAFKAHGWALPPEPRWDITDFGLGEFDRQGLTLVNLCEEPEYCEKLMYAREGQTTPAHCHRQKKEDIIARAGTLVVRVWPRHPDESPSGEAFTVQVDGKKTEVEAGGLVRLEAGSRVTLVPGVYHEFWAEGGPCVIGEVSTANDDAHDNFFVSTEIGRFPGIEEDEPVTIRLVSE